MGALWRLVGHRDGAGWLSTTALKELVGHKATHDRKDQTHQTRTQQNALGEAPALEPEVAAVDRAESVCASAWP